MNKKIKGMVVALLAVMLLLIVAMPVLAAGDEAATDTTVSAETEPAETAVEETQDRAMGDKAWAAAIVVGVAAATGAVSMGWAIAKSVEGISRQPEAEGKIRTTLMLGLVFVETAIIYALVIAILIIFVL